MLLPNCHRDSRECLKNLALFLYTQRCTHAWVFSSFKYSFMHKFPNKIGLFFSFCHVKCAKAFWQKKWTKPLKVKKFKSFYVRKNPKIDKRKGTLEHDSISLKLCLFNKSTYFFWFSELPNKREYTLSFFWTFPLYF